MLGWNARGSCERGRRQLLLRRGRGTILAEDGGGAPSEFLNLEWSGYPEGASPPCFAWSPSPVNGGGSGATSATHIFGLAGIGACEDDDD